MKYISTRGQAPTVDFAQAMLSGLAPDGGLYVPETWPVADARLARPGVPYATVARSVLTTFAGDALPVRLRAWEVLTVRLEQVERVAPQS